MDAVHRHVNHLDLAIGRKYLLDVLLDNISGESAQVDLGGFRCRTLSSSVSIILLC